MTEQPFDIEKAAGIIIKNRKAVLTRSFGKNVFVPPGGKLEGSESQVAALIRELKEELGIDVIEDDLEFINNYFAEAAGGYGNSLKMGVWIVGKYAGDMRPQNEIDEVAEVGSELPSGMKVGSIFEHDVIPYLKRNDLID